nr:RNA-dependent RNA polymerase [Otarine picobirnavirus]AMP18957.1 RNA-dependent RNA polymerase [Otarine picobirnavirus]
MSKNKVVKAKVVTNLYSWNDYFNLPNQGLKTYFGRVRSGSDDEYRTPFYKGRDVQDLLKEWMVHVQKLSNKWPTLVEFENDLASKVGPMSIMKPLSERMSDIDHYYDDILSHQEPISHSAIAAVLKEWEHVRGMQLRGQEKTNNLMKKSTNSGSPYFTKRRNVQSKTIPCNVYLNGDDVAQDINHQFWRACAILGWRGQEGGPTAEDVKQRVVWMFPYSVNLAELQVYQPLIEMAQRYRLVPAWISMEEVDKAITRLFDTKGPQDDVICTDFSKFDQHFGPSCQECAREILRGILAGKEAKDWLSNVFPIKYNIPLAFDWGEIRYGTHGMGSGSGGTNADETLTHRALQYEAAQSMGQRLNPNSQCLGDDGILSYPGITVEDVVRSYTAHGLEMNESKQYVSKQDCTYLRRWHHQDFRVDGVCVGVYATSRALGRLCEQERYFDPDIWSNKMVALRQLSILENVKYHPLKEEFVKFCMKGDKYRLGLDIPGFLDNIEAEASKAIDVMPDFLGYTKSQQKDADAGIGSWWIVSYLKSLR